MTTVQTRYSRFGGMCQKIECRIVIQEEVVRASALGTDDIRPLDWVAAEKNREVQPDDVVVALSGVELDSESTWVSCKIGEFTTQSHSGVTEEDWCFHAGGAEEVSLNPLKNRSELILLSHTLVKWDMSLVVSK